MQRGAVRASQGKPNVRVCQADMQTRHASDIKRPGGCTPIVRIFISLGRLLSAMGENVVGEHLYHLHFYHFCSKFMAIDRCCVAQRRHPFSLAHYANHPPAGRRPNIMIAAYDFREEGTFCSRDTSPCHFQSYHHPPTRASYGRRSPRCWIQNWLLETKRLHGWSICL